MIGLLTFGSFIVLALSLGWLGWSVFKRGTIALIPVVLCLLSLLLFINLVAGGTALVAATDIAVVENTLTGQFSTLGPGTHIWPLSPDVFPLITRITYYTLRKQVIEIGADPVKERGVEADSASPGRPTVKFHASGWAYPNKSAIIELHRQYGPTYLDDWVERIWFTALKGIQGTRPYDFVGNHREEMQRLVEQALQSELMGSDGSRLVEVSQLAIRDFSYSPEIDAYLNEVAKKEFERQQAEQQIAVNTKIQEAEKITAETNFIVTKRNAEANKVAVELNAEADAYMITTRYKAEADGVRQVKNMLGDESFVAYQKAKLWNGQLPQITLQEAVPFLSVQ